MSTADLKVFGGSAHPELTEEICRFLGLTPGALELQRFSDGELYIQILENVRGADVFVIQPTIPPAENTLQLLLMIDAFRRSSAARITVVVPYFGYARQERKDKPRVPISAKLMADLIEAAGADRVLTMDLHAPAIQGFFNVPVDHLFAAPVLIQHLQGHGLQDMVVVSPDAGGVERARFYSKKLGGSLAIIDKRRKGPNVAESIHVIGDVEGCDCVVVDDIIDTAGTLHGAVTALQRAGARSVRGCFTHPVLSGRALERLRESPIVEVAVTDTIPLDDTRANFEKIRVLSVAPLLGEAIRRTHTNSSISSLFM
ncbi:MAG: ribose-phosphate pyrophosphokinase [Acidobacteria bacterium]|nr:ribose-phosphate pyrophosphokinase [Acidobacteriota bacterium]